MYWFGWIALCKRAAQDLRTMAKVVPHIHIIISGTLNLRFSSLPLLLQFQNATWIWIFSSSFFKKKKNIDYQYNLIIKKHVSFSIAGNWSPTKRGVSTNFRFTWWVVIHPPAAAITTLIPNSLFDSKGSLPPLAWPRGIVWREHMQPSLR